MNFETILIDLDVTVIDTNYLIQASFKHICETYGYSFSDEDILHFNGPPLITTFSELNPELKDEMIETYRKYNLEHHNDYVKPFPGVEEVLDQLKAKEIPMGIVSTKMRASVELGLEVTGLSHYFNPVITFNDVHNPKPHPEPVLKAMHELSGKKETTLMVGDNYHDIESGKNAGVQTAGVAWSKKGEAFLQTYQPTFMLQDMHDI